MGVSKLYKMIHYVSKGMQNNSMKYSFAVNSFNIVEVTQLTNKHVPIPQNYMFI